MSVTAAEGFVASGVACGIKAGGLLDLALVATDDGRPVPAAGVFTTNKAAAAPVQVSRAHLEQSEGMASAVVLNSGGANAATGAQGHTNARRTCELVAEGLRVDAAQVLVCSTGLIGYQLAIEAVESGIKPLLAARRSGDGGPEAARAIMTTDTVSKEVVVRGDGFTVGGMAKGAAMLAPNMATMLAVLTTDASAEPMLLKRLLARAVDRSFNNLLVDGATSTNDTVIVLASGRSTSNVELDALEAALWEACADLAGQMAADAEGATRVATIVVEGAASADDARLAARAVAASQLVQCSLYGADPYWGRVVSELGASGADFDIDRVNVLYGNVLVCSGGVGVAHDEAAVSAHMEGRNVEIVANLNLGSHEAMVKTTDLGPGYIAENMGTS